MVEKISFENAIPASDMQIQELETITGFTFSDSLKDFFKRYAGARPKLYEEDCKISIVHPEGWTKEDVIRRIETVDSIKEQWPFIDYLEEFQENAGLRLDYVDSSRLLPIMELYGCEFYISIGGIHDGKIYHADNGDLGIVLVSESLDRLFDMLSPYQDE